MKQNQKVWEHVDRAFAHADDAFEHADRAFAEASQAFQQTDWENAEVLRENGTHRVRFSATSRSERCRMARRFLGFAVAMIFRGKVVLRFKTSKVSS